jgi:hypothetical protein
VPSDDKDDLLEMLSLVSSLPPDTPADFCLALLQHLAHPRLVSRIGSYSEPESIESNVVFAERPECLQNLWEKVLKENMHRYAAPVLSIITESFSRNRRLRNLAREEVTPWDDLTISRPDIACASPHHRHEIAHGLIDIAKACLAWLQADDAEKASAFIQCWLGSEAPMLRKLAVYGLSKQEIRDRDDMLDRILAKAWLTDSGIGHELMRLIVGVYPGASEPMRVRFLDEAERQYAKEEAEGQLQEGYADHRMFDLLNAILADRASLCAVASARLGEIKKRHLEWQYAPMEFTSGQKVDIAAIPSPISVADLLAKPPAEHLDYLITFRDGDIFNGEPTRGNMCNAVAQAIQKKPSWGIEYGCLLKQRVAEAPADLWHALIHGLRDAPLDEGQWPEALALLNTADLPASVLCQTGFFLSYRIQNKNNQIPDVCLPVAMDLCRHLWEHAEPEHDAIVMPDKQGQWTGLALNHTGGVVVQCVLSMALRERNRAPDVWRGLSLDTRNFLSQVIADTHDRGKYCRVMLAILLAKFFYVDAEWTQEMILPLFDWSRGADGEAGRAWEGHGTAGRIFSDVAHDILPFYADTINRWEGLRQEARNGLAEKYVLMLCWVGFPDNKRLDLALRVGTSGGPNTQAAFAMHIGELLRHADGEVKSENWKAWVLPYLSARVADTEQPPKDEELKQMLAWAADAPDFPRYVREVTKSDGRIDENVGLHFFRFEKARILDQFPGGSVELLTWLLGHVRTPTWSLHTFEKMAEPLVSMADPPAGLEKLLNLLCDRGSPAALGLHDRLQQKRAEQAKRKDQSSDGDNVETAKEKDS